MGEQMMNLGMILVCDLNEMVGCECGMVRR